MTRFKSRLPGRLLSAILVSLLCLGNIPPQNQTPAPDLLRKARALYEQQRYEEALSLLEKIEGQTDTEQTMLRAEVYMLFAACYEKMGKTHLANAFLMKIQLMIEAGELKKFPDQPGLELQTLEVYREINRITQEEPSPPPEAESDEYHFSFKDPEPVRKQSQKKVIQYESRKIKKKKFPWIPVIAGLVVAGVVLYFLLTHENRDEAEFDLPEIEWIYIPAGEFEMGDNFNEGDSDEQPVHKVYLDGYYISKYEISISQYNLFCLSTGRTTLTVAYNLPNWWKDYPAHYVSWQDASDFCQWLSRETGSNIQLPTEAQWERAARGAIQNRYPWGNGPPTCDLANFQGCGSHLDEVFEHPAGATPSGVFNMGGNVAEWCRDWYGAGYYSQSPLQNPLGPASGSKRVVRGGSWDNTAQEIRSANRVAQSPGERLPTRGFRIIKEK